MTAAAGGGGGWGARGETRRRPARIRDRVKARGSLLLLAGLALVAGPALSRPSSADDLRGDEIRISRAAGPISVDGDLGDAGGEGATRVETFYETNPGDNLPPKVRTVARLAYDDRFLYAALECDDPEPAKIRAPFSQRDVLGVGTDHGGIILVSPGVGFDTKYNGFARLELRSEKVRAGDTVLPRSRLVYSLSAVPSLVLGG